MSEQQVPKRDSAELADALAVRATRLSGESWELPATIAMMREASEMLDALRAQLSEDAREREALRAQIEQVFKAGWASGYYDGGEHDCRMFTPTAERAWDDFQRERAALLVGKEHS